jgi:tetratricopeptide (TPR) repeat protein
MENRTMSRREYDLKLLFEMVEDDPNDPRTFYYIGQTYNLLENYDKSLEYYLKRVNHPVEGFIQEKVEACFIAARMSNFILQKPWEECEKLYLRCYDLDKTRPESLYFIGIHYYLEKNFEIAYDYIQRAFKIGYPIHCQYALKPEISYFYIPKFLAELCFLFNNYKLGLECCQLFLEKNKNDNVDYYTMECWNKIFQKLNTISQPSIVTSNKSYICYVYPQEYISLQDNTIVFCNCEEETGMYKHIDKYMEFIYNNKIDKCIISNYTEYLPLTYNSSNVDNVYLVLDRDVRQGEVIIRNSKLKNILCKTQSILEQFNSMFVNLQDLTLLDRITSTVIENAQKYFKFKKLNKKTRVLEIGDRNIVSNFIDKQDEYIVLKNREQAFEFFLNRNEDLFYDFIHVENVCDQYEFLTYWKVLSVNGNMILRRENIDLVKKYILDTDNEYLFLEKKKSE